MLQKVSFSVNHFQLNELQNHALDPSVTFRQLAASKVLERTLQVTSVTLWKSEGASSKEAVGAAYITLLHITLLHLGSQSYQQVFSFRLDPISRSTTCLETKGIPNMHRANMQKEVVSLYPSEVAMMSISFFTGNTQQSASSRCSAPSKEQL